MLHLPHFHYASYSSGIWMKLLLLLLLSTTTEGFLCGFDHLWHHRHTECKTIRSLLRQSWQSAVWNSHKLRFLYLRISKDFLLSARCLKQTSCHVFIHHFLSALPLIVLTFVALACEKPVAVSLFRVCILWSMQSLVAKDAFKGPSLQKTQSLKDVSTSASQ